MVRIQTPRFQSRTTRNWLTVLIVEHPFDGNVVGLSMQDAANGR
jgi:hypothetical protein